MGLVQNIPFRKQVRQQMRMQGMRGGMRGMRPGSARRFQGRMGGLHQGPLGGMGPRQARGPLGGRRNLESPMMRPGSQPGFSFGRLPTPPRMRQLRGSGMRPTSARPWKRAAQVMLGRKNPKRATVVSQPHLVSGKPGETVMAKVTSCYTLDDVKNVFDEIRVPLSKIKPKTNFTVNVPIKIKESAPVNKNEIHYCDVDFGVTNVDDEKVGHQVTIKVKVINP